MKRLLITALCALVAGSTLSATAPGWQQLFSWESRPSGERPQPRERNFHRIATLANYLNNGPEGLGDQTVSEIIAATADGRTLVYTDSPMGAIGFIDITNPAIPTPTGKLSFANGHEPTSVAVLGNSHALVAVNSSASFTDTSGYLAVVDLNSRAVVRQIDLGGQPDSIKISGDKRYAAIAIENERDELLCTGGAASGLAIVEDDDDYAPGINTTEDLCEDGGGVPGGLPQTPFGNPAGYLVVIDLTGPNPFGWVHSDVALTGLAGYGAEDPEPEFVDINARNEAVVTLQENNHIVIVDLRTKSVTADFAAGTVNLTGIDADDNEEIALTDSLANVAREPDAVAWVPGPTGESMIATANEGDLFGGSRGFSIFKQNGDVVYDSGSELEEIAVRHGHYPDSRSDAKGAEPESIAYDRFGGQEYLFVASERGSFVAVYELDRLSHPTFAQLLPAPLGPEGLLTIPHRNLLIASGEEDDPKFGVRSTVMVYELQRAPAGYPQILSNDAEGSPIPWSALSGLTAVPGQRDTLLGVWDGYYSESRVFRIDVSAQPAVITDSVAITGGSFEYDPEGIAIAPDDTLWIASEGNANDSLPNLLLQVDKDGAVLREVGLPAEVLACRAATSRRGTLGSGFEGVAVVGTGASYTLVVAQQRGWDYTTAGCEDLDDDGGGLNALGQPNQTRLWVYDPLADTWNWVSWELATKPANAAWVGLSEVTTTPGNELIVIERDNLTGNFSELKTLVRIGLAAADDRLVQTSEKSIRNILPLMRSTNGWISDKPEGTAVTNDGRLFLATDNDGVDDWSGETSFFPMGQYGGLFP
jgi:hypothetical protein